VEASSSEIEFFERWAVRAAGSADMAEYLKGQCAENYSLDDKATRSAKGMPFSRPRVVLLAVFCRLFTLLSFDHSTLPNVQVRNPYEGYPPLCDAQGRGETCYRFLKPAIDVIVTMTGSLRIGSLKLRCFQRRGSSRDTRQLDLRDLCQMPD